MMPKRNIVSHDDSARPELRGHDSNDRSGGNCPTVPQQNIRRTTDTLQDLQHTALPIQNEKEKLGADSPEQREQHGRDIHQADTAEDTQRHLYAPRGRVGDGCEREDDVEERTSCQCIERDGHVR